MIRFLTFMLGRQYEPCKSCETLKEQLSFANAEKRELTATLLNIISPKAVEAVPVVLQPIEQSSALFSRRRAALEEADRQKAHILRNSRHVAAPDKEPKAVDKEIEKLESELGINAEEKGA